MKVYLCGGINGLTDDEACSWREWFKQSAPEIEWLDPMRRDYRGREAECVEEIVSGDLTDINSADVVLVNAARPSWGTAMELFYARYVRFKRVITIHPEGKALSPWLQKYSHVIVHTRESALEALRG